MKTLKSNHARYIFIAIASYFTFFLDSGTHIRAVITFVNFALVSTCGVLTAKLISSRVLGGIAFIVVYLLAFNAFNMYLADHMNLTQKVGNMSVYVSGRTTAVGLLYNSGVCVLVSGILLIANIALSYLQRRI